MIPYSNVGTVNSGLQKKIGQDYSVKDVKNATIMSEEEKTEARIQQDIVMWFRNEYCLKHHEPRSLIMSIPNNREHGMKEVGMMSGASDLLVMYSKDGLDFEGMMIYWVEVKTPKGRQSPKQKVFQEHVEQMGMEYVIVRSREEFILMML